MIARLIAVLAMALFAHAAGAQQGTAPPVDGIYWNAAQSGRGYAVETQDNLVFVAIYNFAENGDAAFYFVQGTWDAVNRRILNPHLYKVDSGPWIGAPFSPIGATIDLGPVVFEFPTFTTGRFIYNGQTVLLERFLYGYAPQADSLMGGVWHATFGDLGVYFGDIIQIDGPCPVTSCGTIPEAFEGRRYATGGNTRLLVGGRDIDDTVFFLLDSSDAYYSLYVFDLRVNQWFGWENTFPKNQTTFPSTGLTLFGTRLVGPTAINSTAGATDAAAEASMDAMRAAASAGAAPPLVDGKVVRLDRIEAMLPALKQALRELQ
jgi:hypothetical protein